MRRQILLIAWIATLAPALATAEVTRRIDEIQITDTGIRIRAGEHVFDLSEGEAARIRGDDWFIRGDRIVWIADGEERVLVPAVDLPLTPLPRSDDDLRRRRVEIDRLESGVFIRFHEPDARDVVIEGTFTGWAPRPMHREEEDWVYTDRLPNGEHRFRIRYRLGEDEHWFEEPARGYRLSTETRSRYVLEVDDREIAWYVDEEEETSTSAGLGANYNRVEGLRLSYRLGLEHGLERRARLAWSQAYSFAVERWSWDATLRVPLVPVPGLAFEAEGFDQVRIPMQWTVTPNENLAAALLIREDFYDYVWSRGFDLRLVQTYGAHTLTATYGERTDAPLVKETEWSLFGGDKKFRENLFAETAGVAGETRRIEGRYVYDDRNYKDSPTMGWYAELHGDYAGWELGGDYDYWKGVADFRRFQKLSSRMHLDLRVMGGAIQATAPRQEMFFLGGVGTLRAHDLKELVGNRFFLANIEYRAAVWGDFQCAFFADLGDAWDTPERRDFDLESDMGIGILDDDGDIRVDLARRVGVGVDEDLVVTLRLARMF